MHLMNDWLDKSRARRESWTPTIWGAIALSILVHTAAMWRLPQVRLATPDPGERTALSVNLAPPPSPPPQPPARRIEPPAPARQPAPKAAPRRRSAPPIIAREQPSQGAPSPPPRAPAVAAPNRTVPPVESDLSSYIESRRRARAEAGEAAPPRAAANTSPVEDENARVERIVAANLGQQSTMAFGYDPTRTGGVFQIERMGYDSAEFIFYGWHRAMRRNVAQLVEVRKGDNENIRIAVIRRMISIIREYEQDDFVWESHRLRRNVTLSARPRDNAGLEDFLMVEFFGEQRLAR